MYMWRLTNNISFQNFIIFYYHYCVLDIMCQRQLKKKKKKSVTKKWDCQKNLIQVKTERVRKKKNRKKGCHVKRQSGLRLELGSFVSIL